MNGYDAPGAYYERRDSSGGGVSTLRTDIAAFVGIARRGPVGLPVPIESWRQFEAHFGGFTGVGYLAYVVRAFFENGGRRCWVVRVGSAMTAAARTPLHAVAGQPLWWVEASSQGAWGNDLEVQVTELRRHRTRGVATSSGRDFLAVTSTAGFSAYDLVALRRTGLVEYATVARVDQAGRRLYFEDPARPKPYFAPLPATIPPGAEVRVETIAYALEVREAGRLLRLYDDVSVVPDHPRYGPRLLPSLLRQLRGQGGAAPGDTPFVTARAALPPLPEPLSILEPDPIAAAAARPRPLDLALPLAPGATGARRRRLTDGADGLAILTPGDFIGQPAHPQDDDEAVARKARGLAALEAIPEISLVAIPDIHIVPRDVRVIPPPPCVPDPCLPPPPLPPAPPPGSVGDLPPRFSDSAVALVQAAMIQQCEARKDRVALLDPPLSAASDARLGVAGIAQWRQGFDSTYGALYFPWVEVVDPLRLQRSPTLRIPPCGHVAGQIAEWDLRVGVHRAPANAALNWVQDVTIPVDDRLAGELNPRGINAIRALPGRAIRVFGARTTSSDPDWRFLNVRRLLVSIRRALDAALQWAVFEPNDWMTRLKIDLAIRGYLTALWERGALTGAVPEEAFFVRCDDGNNPPRSRDLGQLIAEVGVAPSVPFEFVVVRVGRQNNSFEYAEAPLGAVRAGV
jgi:hypothetical protein